MIVVAGKQLVAIGFVIKVDRVAVAVPVRIDEIEIDIVTGNTDAAARVLGGVGICADRVQRRQYKNNSTYCFGSLSIRR